MHIYHTGSTIARCCPCCISCRSLKCQVVIRDMVELVAGDVVGLVRVVEEVQEVVEVRVKVLV